MEVKANLKYIRVSPQKCRLIVDLIRGKKVADALDILHYSKQKVNANLHNKKVYYPKN